MLGHRFGSISRTYRHVQRYRDIAGVLLKHGFGGLVTQLGLHRHLPFRSRRQAMTEETVVPSHYGRIRSAFEELGPTFVKLGQFLSTRRDVLPARVIEELEKLQDTVRPFPGEAARTIVVSELGHPIERLFQRFADEPFASASMAQVHEAMTNDGEHVVVKVQRPKIRGMIETDLEIMADLARLLERLVEGAELFEPVNIVREFAQAIRRELDFGAEANNAERFAADFAHDKRIHVPKVYRDLSTSSVLTMEYVKGTKVSTLVTDPEAGIDPEVVASRGAALICEQIFEHGFYHADPHPGNILVQPGNVICLLDYGMVGVLPNRQREQLSNLVLGLVKRDERQITAAVLRLADYSRFERLHRIEADVAHFIEYQLYRPLRDIHVGEVLNELTRLLVRHGIRMPPDFFLLTKALTLVESVGRQLAPDFDVVQHMKPFAKRLLRQRMNPKRMGSELLFSAFELQALLRDMPSEMREMLTMLKHGELRLNVEHRGLEELIRSHDQISNRTVFAIVLAALIVGSSLMVLSDIPPKWHEIPIIGVVGFVVSGILGFSLLYTILRHRRM